MSNTGTILKNVGVGLRGIKTDEVSLKRYIQKYELLYAAFESTPITGSEVCDKGNIVVHNESILYHNEADKQPIILT